MRRRWAVILTVFLILGLLAAGAGEISRLDDSLQARLAQGWFLPPTEFYTPGLRFSAGTVVDMDTVKNHLTAHDFRLRLPDDPLRPKDFTMLDRDACQTLIGTRPDGDIHRCLVIRAAENDWSVIGVDDGGKTIELWSGPGFQPINEVSVAPVLIAQFYQGQPLFKEPTELPSVPLACLQAVTAIEDGDFLRHKGVSVVGILRAIYRNVMAGHWAEGGSTITQQLVKNYFLSPKKTIRRKITEQVLAVLLESRTSKDTILEQYLNVIYMGMAGSYQVRGFASASRVYFGKPISDLNLPECALLAAMVNSPGRYNPYEHPDHALKRRELVLQRMAHFDLISPEELRTAAQAPLPSRPPAQVQPPAPYFLQTASRELDLLDLTQEHGLRVLTSLDSDFQDAANQAVSQRLKQLEEHAPKKDPNPLQIALISVDLATRHVVAVVGGRGFQQTQFNRIVDGLRQVGSTVKPFVYLTAMDTLNPLSERLDEAYEYKYDRQVWAPNNYDEKFRGAVPLFYGLAESLNVPAARTAIEVGLKNVVANLQAAGVSREIPAIPALALGAFELSPWDVAQAYSTLGNFGSYQAIHTILRVETLSGEVLWDESKLPIENRLKPTHAAEVIGMMKTTPIIGTAQSLNAFDIPQVIAAKTGTTNDLNDAWFVGLTPQILTIVWVGFDHNKPVGTGAGMALPVWGAYHKRIAPLLSTADFKWPDGTEVRSVDLNDLGEKFPFMKTVAQKAAKLDLVFEK